MRCHCRVWEEHRHGSWEVRWNLAPRALKGDAATRCLQVRLPGTDCAFQTSRQGSLTGSLLTAQSGWGWGGRRCGRRGSEGWGGAGGRPPAHPVLLQLVSRSISETGQWPPCCLHQSAWAAVTSTTDLSALNNREVLFPVLEDWRPTIKV